LGSRAGVNGFGDEKNLLTLAEFEPRFFQPVVYSHFGMNARTIIMTFGVTNSLHFSGVPRGDWGVNPPPQIPNISGDSSIA